MNEQAIEQHLKQAVEAIGGLCWKFTSPGTSGVPDRICIHRGRVIFVELKAPGRLPRPIQRHRIQQLTDHGMDVVIVDSIKGTKEVADALRAA
ncbi:VRR-NUC domain-containing protein [Corynebacterium vitaeruminis]|uniref:VRR-NUC domain-containing protein n=1 Tax=Corynebacterium vitaeruminis TaxID=38305 RepID=UPI0005510689|nr:VRR-NUC domain-containing protein [Corynebacterium vitaeruminis]